MEEELIKIKNDASSLIIDTDDTSDLEKIQQDFLGKHGQLTVAIKSIAKLPESRRPEVGRLANEIKKTLEELLKDKKSQKKKNASKKTSGHDNIDVTIPGVRPPLGHLHLVTSAIEEITAIFEKIGFSRVRYPEVEWDYYAFGALNFPPEHPARDDWETFFVDSPVDPKYGPMLLTPHTSSGQIREMERVKGQPLPVGRQAPIKMLNIAKCYRRQSDVSHTPMFHQFEGLVIGEKISITHLKGTLDYFVKSYFGQDRISRIRPYHFQFTEPSFEVDVSCGVCKGTGILRPTRQAQGWRAQDGKDEPCRLCKEGWLEMGGAGMVHPNVLKAGGVDTEKYTGFAFGWGVERVLMMKEGLELDDLRLLYSSNLEFLEQF